MQEEKKILAANYAFYSAYRFADFKAMNQSWAKDGDIAMYGPGQRSISGRDALLSHWRRRLNDTSIPDIRPKKPAVIQVGSCAIVVCEEDHGDVTHIATNVFVKHDGRWNLINHNTSGLDAFRPVSV